MLFTHRSRESYGMPSKNLKLGPCAAVKQFAVNCACEVNVGDAPSNMSS